MILGGKPTIHSKKSVGSWRLVFGRSLTAFFITGFMMFLCVSTCALQWIGLSARMSLSIAATPWLFAPLKIRRKMQLLFWALTLRKPRSQVPGAFHALREFDEKTLILIRHGESEWNNRIKMVDNAVLRGSRFSEVAVLFRWLCTEAYLLFSAHSVLLDPPLTNAGVKDAKELRAFVEMAAKADPPPGWLTSQPVLCCSNLRRAAATALIGLEPLLSSCKAKKVFVLSHLQEFSECPDTVALAPPQQPPPVGKLEEYLDASGNIGQTQNIRWTDTPQNDFCDWVFEQQSQIVIAVGHSGFMLELFKALIPELDMSLKVNSDCGIFQSLRHSRVPTGSMVQCSLLRSRNSSERQYRIAPNSAKFLHGQGSFGQVMQ